jgi:hypothetical protein
MTLEEQRLLNQTAREDRVGNVHKDHWKIWGGQVT